MPNNPLHKSIKLAMAKYQCQKKIFCIGFNKTGTTSLHQTFLHLGLTSKHNVRWTKISRVQPLDKDYFNTQCYTDGYRSNFVTLDKNFPGSLFIYNDRNERFWLRSRVKHYLRFHEAPSPKESLRKDIYPWLAKDLFTNSELAIRKWICEYRIYKKQAEIYFHGRKDFTTINISDDQDYTNKVISFLNVNGFRYPNQKSAFGPFRSNTRDDQELKEELTQPLFELIDSILEKFDTVR